MKVDSMAALARRARATGLAAGAPMLLAGLVVGCTDETGLRPTASEATGIFADLGEMRPDATEEQRATFDRGRRVAVRRFGQPEGLGPTFNVSACGACHERPVIGGGGARYRQFGLVAQTLPDGSFQNLGKSGVLDHYTLDPSTRVPTPDQTNVMATRVPIPFFGVGLLAEIPDASILANADPDDADGDGVSGRPNYDRGFVGRFGRKSQTVSIEGFIRGPIFNHAGITSDPLPDALRNALPVPSGTRQTEALGAPSRGALAAERVGEASQAQAAAPDTPTIDDDGVPDPELGQSDLFDLVSFSMLLGAPRRDAPTTETDAGRELFHVARCDACHVPSLEGPRGLVPAYSDLLLHDMGDALADDVVMKVATGREFRTQPLWGVAAGGPYLHDGRADTIDESIRLHEGEGRASRDAYLTFGERDRAKVVAFLASLGGASQRSEGLLPPDAPLPEDGDYGGPAIALSASDRALVLAGRAVFDRDVRLGAGLGPRHNGDSCRACHFDPVIGGAGPIDVNVVRQGIVRDGAYSDPAGGTMLHRHSTTPGTRPEPAALVNLFEARQPPPVFGLGLVERIPDATILAHEDPDDADGDGVRGHARRLPDGRIGRLGWKAGVPSLAEFARDAMSNELGVTVPSQVGLTFGFSHDADGVSDPEITTSDLAALTFYMAQLAPPPRTRSDPAVEHAGAQLFEKVGCATCHTPAMTTSDGVKARLYSDLLLHDVAPDGAAGIADGAATMREFRTTPLWGLAKTAPYMHDGRAFTIGDAVRAHHAEAKASVATFDALSEADRAELVAFLGSL